MDHPAIDRRSLMMHRIIPDRLRANSALLETAQANMVRWNCKDRGWWREWREILEKPLEEIIAILERDEEVGCRLRQNSPFTGILSPQEVWKLKREFAQTHRSATNAVQASKGLEFSPVPP